MSEVKTLFRYCPACGKRFHIRLVNKKLARDEKVTSTHKEVALSARTFMGQQVPAVLEEDVPVTIDVEDFEYSYKCKHCGYTWTETHRQEERVKG